MSALRMAVGGGAAATFVAGALLVSGASAISAPEPARLNGSLYSTGSSASATYVYSQAPTVARQWPGTWAAGSLPAGTPCATYNAPYGTTLYWTIQASGSYRKCM